LYLVSWRVNYVLARNCDEKVYVVNNGPTLWFEANILCRQAGMEMASVESYKEEESLEIELNKLTNPRSV